MKKTFIFFILIITLSCNHQKNKAPLLEKGVSKHLALYRKQQVSEVVYNLKFHIPLQREAKIKSQVTIHATVSDVSQPLYLDFNEDTSSLKSLKVNNTSIKINHQKEHIIIAKDYLKIGENVISILFDAGELSLNRNEDYLYTLLVPDRASTLFPCFDQPDIKANYTLNITAPTDWKVLCGALLKEKVEEGSYTNYQYGMSDKMSTYLFSFVAGDFNKQDKNLEGLSMNLLFRENNKEKIAASLDAIFKLHQQSVEYLEFYTQQKFPFQKLDFATIPGFQYGGMEHVGAIQYRESLLFLDSNATQNQQLNRTKLIAHETAHMWFGNLVTMEWFDDVWLKEVFANFMADKIANPLFPEINHSLQFMTRHYPYAYSEDRTRGTNPIRQELQNLKNAGSLYGNIIYHKAPIMMRQLEAVMGEEAFRKGIQQYIKKYANSNASWNDLILLLDAETNVDLNAWSSVWVHQSGRPLISEEISYDNNVITDFKIHQQAEDGSNHLWPQTFDMALVYQDSILVKRIELKDKTTTVKSLIGLHKPQAVIYNYNALGYGVFPIDTTNLSIHNIKNDVARGYSYVNLYENMLNAKVAPQQVFSQLLKGLGTEKNELIVGLVSGNLSSVFWNYLSDKEQLQVLETTEPFLRGLLHKNLNYGIKKTIFNLYKSIAYSTTGKDFLYKLWSKNQTIDGLKLNEADYTSLATVLAIYEHDKASDILAKAALEITNGDRKKRFEFLLPSLSNNLQERDAFMESLSDSKNREKESWVVAALANIHHPLRQETAKKHIPLCLDLLEEIQLTGDIFFPKSWLNNTVGKYHDKDVLNMVDAYLSEHPNLNPVLRNKLLQATDGLLRYQKI